MRINSKEYMMLSTIFMSLFIILPLVIIITVVKFGYESGYSKGKQDMYRSLDIENSLCVNP